jgi:hypothetical protein
MYQNKQQHSVHSRLWNAKVLIKAFTKQNHHYEMIKNQQKSANIIEQNGVYCRNIQELFKGKLAYSQNTVPNLRNKKIKGF